MLARIIGPIGSVILSLLPLVAVSAVAQPPDSAQPPPSVQPAQATQTPDAAATPSVSVAEYGRRIQAIENSTDLDEKQKAKAIDAYKQAISLAEVEATFQQQAADFQSKLTGLSDALATVRSELADLPSAGQPPTEATLDELNSDVRLKSAAVEQLRQGLAGIDADVAQRDKRLLDIPTEIADASQRMSTVDKDRNNVAPDADPMVKAAVTASVEQRRSAIQAELDSLKTENTWRVSQGELLRQRREKTRRELDTMQAELSNWQQAAQDKRETEVDRDLRLAREQLENVRSSMESIANENVELAERRLSVQRELQLATAEQERVAGLAKKLEQSFERSRQEVEAGAGLSQSLGEVLREKKLELRTLSQKLKNTADETTRVSEARLRLYVLRNKEAELEELSEAVSASAAELGLSTDETPKLEELLRFQQSLVTGLRTDTEAWFQVLAKLAGSAAQLRSVADQFTTFIDEHVLWVRSTEMFGPQQVSDTVTAVRGAVAPSRWRQLGDDLYGSLRRRPLLPLMLVCLAVLLLRYHSRMRGDLKELSRRAESGSCRDFTLSLRAALLTVGIAVGWPSIVLLAGTWLNNSPYNSVEIRCLAAGLMSGGAVALLLEAWRQAARPNGMMVSHFNAPARAAQLMYSNLRWFSPTLSISIGITVAALAAGNPQIDQSLGRAALMFAMLAMAVFVYRMGHPTRGAVQAFFAYRPHDMLFKWRHLLFAVAIGTPLTLAILAFIGYQYTADQLAHRMLWTVAALFGLWFVQALVLRWVVLSRRRLAIEQARARMASGGDAAEQDPQPELEEIDLTSVDLQTRRLVRAIAFVVGVFALWTLWMDALPALARFDELKAWDISVPASAAAVAEGAAEGDASSGATVRMVSYADVGKAIAIVIAMVLAMRDLPGLLELVLLQRLPLDNALRFAISTLTRYLIFMIGAVSALGAIEIGWSQVQWLVAGVSVGLGFGLQEIFANFVSGLIILFERPLRAGDIVTIDGVTGIVKRVRMRSTIIQDWDRKDLVVPNRDFITGRLLNWTLSDEVSRIVLPVGVAYGSDTDKAKEIVRSVAAEHPLISAEPAPMVTFEGFGDSSLDLVLRCFISLQNMASRLQVIDDLHTRIDQRFRDAGVEIPFPQRDVHFRSSLPIESDGRVECQEPGASAESRDGVPRDTSE